MFLLVERLYAKTTFESPKDPGMSAEPIHLIAEGSELSAEPYDLSAESQSASADERLDSQIIGMVLRFYIYFGLTRYVAK
ncbi:hypothetical protein JOC34_002546 [Virgibacillus halotolerans]|nr:hypothetical protein [Virgibacillus halotolerans]